MQESKISTSFFYCQDNVKPGIMFLLWYIFLILCIDEMLLVRDLLEKKNKLLWKNNFKHSQPKLLLTNKFP